MKLRLGTTVIPASAQSQAMMATVRGEQVSIIASDKNAPENQVSGGFNQKAQPDKNETSASDGDGQ